MAWTEGWILGEDTTLIAELDRADARTLWSAHDGNNRRVTVEVANPEPGGQPRALLAFHADAEAATGLRHPTLLTVFEHGLSEGGLPYVVRQAIPPRSVMREVAETPLGLRQVARVVEQLLQLLDTLHPKGLARAGVTPDNVFLVGEDVKLWIQLVVTGPTAAARELACVAPELTTSQGPPLESDSRASLWEVAALAYHALCGRPPFLLVPGDAFAASVGQGAFPRLALCGDGGEASRIELEGWFVRALAADPAARFATAREMLDAWLNVVGSLLLFVDDAEDGIVTLVPRSGNHDSAAPTAMFDRDLLFSDDEVTRLHSILDDDDEVDTVISLGDEVVSDAAPSSHGAEGSKPASENTEAVACEAPPPKPVMLEANAARVGVLASPSGQTEFPLSRTVPPVSKAGRRFGPSTVLAGVVVAALSSMITTWLSEGNPAGAGDCPAQTQQAPPPPQGPSATQPPAPPPSASAVSSDRSPPSAGPEREIPGAAEKGRDAIEPEKVPPTAPLRPIWPSKTRVTTAPAQGDSDDPYGDGE